MNHDPACETVRCGCGNPRCGECEDMCNCEEVSRVHDPLCPVLYGKAHPLWKAAAPLADLLCECDLIARVREDERGKQFVSDDTMTRIADGLAKATPVDEATWNQSTYDTGYADALRDALEAVKALDPNAPGGNMDYGINVQRRAVAAIEALGGER